MYVNLTELLSGAWLLPLDVIERGKALMETLPAARHLRSTFYRDNEEAPHAQTFGREFDRRSRDPRERLLGSLGASMTRAGTLVVPVMGVMGKRMSSFGLSERGTSSEMLRDAFRVTREAPEVKALVLHVDSPGGSVFGVELAADMLASLSREKPTAAMADEMMASGAYYLASQARHIAVAPTAYVGSVGVYMTRVEQVGNLETDMGSFRVHVVASSREKVDGHPSVSVDDDELARYQADVDFYYAMFRERVASGRGLSGAALDAVADGTLAIGQQAVDKGFADSVTSIEALVAEMDAHVAAL